MSLLDVPVKAGDLVFVYGTLRRGQTASLENKDSNEFITEDRINGKLYNLGWFPGVNEVTPIEKGGFISEGPTVVGEVFRIDDPSLGVLLDNYEGHPDYFHRVQVSTEKGLSVWVYQYPLDVREDALVPTGDWIKRSEPVPTVFVEEEVA